MQYDSLFSVSKAIAEKMGADSTKKYDSTYSVALEILNRMGSAGGDASKLESVDVLPTEGVKDGDVVYLKGNAEKADGFYVATLGGDGSATWTMISDGGSSTLETVRELPTEGVKNGDMVYLKGMYNKDDGFYVASVSPKDGSVTWHIIVDGNIGIIKTDTLNYVSKYSDKLYLKTDNDGYNRIYGNYHIDRAVDKPMQYETNYYAATLNITDSDWQANDNLAGTIGATIIVPSISQNNECKVRFDFDNNHNITPSIDKEYMDIFEIQNPKEHQYYIVYKSNSFVFCQIQIYESDHRINFYSLRRDKNPFNFKNNSITGTNLNPLDLSQSEGVIEYEKDIVSQYMPYQDKDGNIIEGGQKLSEKYNPYNTTTANDNYKFPRWNEYGQIIGGYDVNKKKIWINKSKSTNSWGYLYGEYVNEFPDLMVMPTAFGTSGQVLQSAGEGNAPTWTDLIKIQKITQDAYDALEVKDDNVLYVITN